MILKNCPLELFFAQNEGKKISIYGIGNEFEKVTDSFTDLPWGTSISNLMDADSGKWGKDVSVQGKMFTIKNPSDVFSNEIPNVILVLPTKNYALVKEIVDFLDMDDRLNDVECYLLYLMKLETGYEKMPIQYAGTFHIPPTIHYCWFGKKPLPAFYKKCIESWHRFCPDYQVIEWNEDNLDMTENDFSAEAYRAGKYGFVPDYFRLKVIYENGGIYLDTDVEVIKNLDPLRREKAFCGLDRFGRVALGLGFGADKHNPQVKRLMETYRGLHFSTEREEGLMSPLLQTNDFKKMGMRECNQYQRVGDFTVFPTEVLSPKSPATFETKITEYSFSIHHFDGSWVSDKKREKDSKARQSVRGLLERCRKP